MINVNPFCAILILICFCQSMVAQEYNTEKLNGGINTAYDEISPVISLDGKTMYFTRVGSPDFVKTLIEDGVDLSQSWDAQKFNSYLRTIYTKIARKTIVDPARSSFNQDIWVAQSLNDEFDQVLHPGFPLNNALPNSVSSLTPAGNELIIINRFEKEGGMKKGFSLVRDPGDGYWSFPEPIGIEDYYNTGSDVSMTMSSDGSVLILSMDRYDSKGKNDLYICHKIGAYQWSKPENIGSIINTSFRETTPFLSEDNQTLFFSSSRGGGVNSNNDIYMAKRDGDDWKSWKRPRRLIKPINSSADDSQPYFNSATGYLYFTSKRDGTSDIFRVKIAPAIPRFVTVTGSIFDGETKKPMKNTKVLSGSSTNRNYQNVYVANDGTFRISVPKGVEFTLLAEKPGFIGKEEKISFRKDYVYYKEHQINLSLTPIEEGTKLELDPIYFMQSKAVIKQSSYPVLNKLARFLNDNYNVTIRIEGHTDNQGEKEALQKLSEERAEAVKRYLVYQKRINPLRIETLGKGDSDGLTDNSSEEKRIKNRRVEVFVIDVHQPTEQNPSVNTNEEETTNQED